MRYVGDLTYESVHTARKSHRCDVHLCRHWINPGARYRRSVMFPGDINGSGVPWVMRVCQTCAERSGRPLEVQP